ncbi:hypothetical protein HPP92_019993 [Vanilla planifolia]|uniref:histone acetyltransferase n=1 Tax=Vanilla planifolia TaxID=51239 RepID=A0A835Q538_VANPL|nr:hypothetical protein HPP92_019993 [Vanilla planifolia]
MQVPNLAGQQVSVTAQLMANSLPSQLQTFSAHSYKMDPDLSSRRRRTLDYILQLLQRKNHSTNAEVVQRIPELAKHLEERIYRDAVLQGEDYTNMSSITIDQRLQGIMKILNNTQQSQYISSAASTMIPTPGMINYGNKGPTISQDSTMVSTSGGGMISQTAANFGNVFSNANGSVGIGQNTSLNSTTGTTLNGYEQSPGNIIHNSGVNNFTSSIGMMRQSSQMIPTPGLNNQQSVSLNSESSSGGLFSGMESSATSQNQQKQYVGGQNNHLLHGIGIGVGARSHMQRKLSSYRFPNGIMNGGIGSLIGNNMQHVNGPTVTEGYLASVSYGGSSKPLQQQMDKQQLQSLVTSDGYAVNSSDISGSGNIYGSGSNLVSAEKSQNLNPSMSFKSKASHGILTHQTGLPSASQMKAQMVDSQSMNFQSTQSTQDQLLQSHHMQNFQHQQFQQLNQPSEPLLQHHSYHRNQPQQQFMPNTDKLRHSSIPSSFVGQLIPENGFDSTNDALLPQPSEQFHLSELQNQYQQNISYRNLPVGVQLVGQSQGSQDLQGLPSQFSQILQAEQQTTESQNELSCLFVGSQTDALPQEHWYPNPPQKSHVQDKILFEQHLQEEFNQIIIGRDEAQGPEISPYANTSIPCATVPQTLHKIYHGTLKSNREGDYFKQRRWLLLLLHSCKCPSPKGHCKEVNCIKVQNLWMHIKVCTSDNCTFPRCTNSKKLLNHYITCKAADCPEVKSPGVDVVVSGVGSSPSERSDCQQSSFKRLKVQAAPSLLPKVEAPQIFAPTTNQNRVPKETKSTLYQQNLVLTCNSAEVLEVKVGSSLLSGQCLPDNQTEDMPIDVLSSKVAAEPSQKEAGLHKKNEMQLPNKDLRLVKIESNKEGNLQSSDPATATKSGKPKIKGVSLTELFTPEQIKEHIISLRQWVGQSKAKAEKNQAMERSMSENSCQLCAVEKLTFEPPPIYCTPCGARQSEMQCFIPLGLEIHAITSVFHATMRLVVTLLKQRDQCFQNQGWRKRKTMKKLKNGGYSVTNVKLGSIKYVHFLMVEEMIVNKQNILVLIAMLRRLKKVPGAEALVVRVVSSVDKKLEVKQRFLEIFQEENYPTEFPYKSKVILLFQKIEGVEVCLFGMYVQEFGSECQFPNQRRVYLSYLDSVKYFRPEIKTVTGEALRTFVYHEILGEDYILYCHPEIQKTPKSDKLREWYLSMLRKAAKESIVVGLTNLSDHFFVSTGECKAKVTAARLPYFDGDYWPGAAEDMINQLQQEEDGRKQQKKGKTKNTLTKRALKAAGHTDLGCNASKDALLMHKLGETISPMKEDFIMVHLQHACTHCCILMVSGNRWVCNQCKNFQLCDMCYEAEQRLENRDRHPVNSRDMHDLYPIEINDVPADTKDKDEIVESEFFDTRQAFLSLCQGNHYQYDTLRRAKHSSMMVLYHLHNPTAPAFVTTCNVCYHDIETGQGWRREICPEFDVCNTCYQRDGGIDHQHKLTNKPSNADRDAQSQEARQIRVIQLRKMLDLLVHASQCRFPHCQYPNCRKVKGLFRHGIQCKTRVSGGCVLCKKMWYLLQLHARACKESECHVPRCRDLKEHLKRLQQQSESRRRAAVMEMMRQRAAELQAIDD